MARSEGAAVRHAMNGPDVDHDRLISFAAARNEEDAERASSAGESRQLIGKFLEDTGMNGKALSWLRIILKQKKTDKAMDIIRSLEHGLPMVKQHLGGQQSEMDLVSGKSEEDLEPGEPEFVDPDAALPAPSYKPTFTPGVDPELDAETVAFEDHLAEVQG